LGYCDPVLIDERNTVLDGVVRVEARKVKPAHLREVARIVFVADGFDVFAGHPGGALISTTGSTRY